MHLPLPNTPSAPSIGPPLPSGLSTGCFPVLLCPDLWSILLGVAGVALGAGPSYAMIISMAKVGSGAGAVGRRDSECATSML